MSVRAAWFGLGLLAWLACLAGCATPPPAAPPEMRLQTGRYGHDVVAADHRLFVVGGSGPEGLLGDVEVLDPKSGTAAVVATNLIPRRYHSAVLVGRRDLRDDANGRQRRIGSGQRRRPASHLARDEQCRGGIRLKW